MATIINQGAVRIQSSAANPAARSASRYAMVPGNAPADMRRARCQAIIPSAISVAVDPWIAIGNFARREVRQD